MPITEKQKEERKRYVGSSDAAAVLGLDPNRTRMDVFLDKTGQIEASGREHSDDATEVGNFCEGGVLDWFESKKGVKLARNIPAVHENKVMAANLDAMISPKEIVEAKTTAVVSRFINEQWGEVGTDEVPERVALQCQHQMAVVTTAFVVWVPVLMGGVGFRLYRVERNEELIRDLTEVELDFWNNHVLKGVPPGDSVASFDTLKKLRREKGKEIELSEELVMNWMVAKDILRSAEAAKQEKERLLLAALGDAEIGNSPLGTVSYTLRERKEYTVAASQYRQLSYRKNKEAK